MLTGNHTPIGGNSVNGGMPQIGSGDISGTDRLIDLVIGDPDSLLKWAVGDSWTLWNRGGISSGNRQLAIASLSAPSLPGGLIWDTSQLHSAGTIAYVPERSRAVLLLATSLLALRRRRRSFAPRTAVEKRAP